MRQAQSRALRRQVVLGLRLHCSWPSCELVREPSRVGSFWAKLQVSGLRSMLGCSSGTCALTHSLVDV